MKPGATSAVLRWRVGAWLVGVGVIGLVADVFKLRNGVGFWSLCLFLMLLGALVANPPKVMGRLRSGQPSDPVVRLRPLGVLGFIVMMVLFLVPFAIGEWLLNMIGELFERRAEKRVAGTSEAEDAIARQQAVPWPGAEGFEDVFYDEDDPNRKRRGRMRRLVRR